MDNIIQTMIKNEEEKKKEEKKNLGVGPCNHGIQGIKRVLGHNYDISIDEYMGKEKPPEDDTIIIIQDGGIGDTICSTVMLKSAREVYKDKTIVLASFYPDVFLNNPNIDHLYATNSLNNMYEKWVKKLRWNKSLLKSDIYNGGVHKIFPGKLSEAICYYYKLPYQGDDIKVYLTEDEEKEAKIFLNSFPRDVILINVESARINYKPDFKITTNKDWYEDSWKELVSMLVKDFDVVQIGGPCEKPIEGITTNLTGQTNIRQVMALIKHSLTTISIDSFIGHVSPAVGKSGVVLFGRSNPYIFGHETNVNIWVDNSCKLNDMFCGRPQSYWGDNKMIKGTTKLWECPDRSCMRAITPEMVYRKVFESIERNTKK